MNRRDMLFSAAAGVFAAMVGGMALAEGPVEQVIRQLRAQGFVEISAQRTLLGRSRIQAERGKLRREIILNPTSGEILRDLWLDSDGNVTSQVVIADSNDDKSGGGGGSDVNDDDDSDVDDSDDERDTERGDSSGGGGGGADNRDDDD